MKKKTIAILSLVMAFVIVVSIVLTVNAATIYIVDGYQYELNNIGLARLVGVSGTGDTLNVPNEIGDVQVAEIGSNAFSDNANIKSLNLLDATRLYKIGMYAFYNSALEGTLVIPTRVTDIGISAFERCMNLTEVSYSSDGGSVSAQCFMNCTSLEKVTLTDYITTIDRYAFANCYSLSEIVIPSSVTYINPTAFNNDDQLVIYCYYGSDAQQYAEERGIEYVIIDAENIPTEPSTEPMTEPATDPGPTEEPTMEPATEAQTDAPTGYYLGDADGNGTVESVDATWVQRYAARMAYPMSAEILMHADVDGDGVVGIVDATLIQRYVAKAVLQYPIGTWIE